MESSRAALNHMVIPTVGHQQPVVVPLVRSEASESHGTQS